jgi:hypothetical protein
MKTTDLISMLATGIGVEPEISQHRRFGAASVTGIVLASILMLASIHLNPEIYSTLLSWKFWVKLGFVAAMALVSFNLLSKLSRPGSRINFQLVGLLFPVVAMWLLSALILLKADSPERESLIFGQTWAVCPFLISMLSVPVFISTLWAMREAAPTRLKLTGAVVGLFSGAMGAAVYCFHCPELEAPFISIWYLLGMLIPTAIGALCGEKFLRW